MSRRNRLFPPRSLLVFFVSLLMAGAMFGQDPPGITSVCAEDPFDQLSTEWATTHLGDSDQGSAVTNGGRLRLSGDGTSLFHGDDNGFFVHQEANGNFRVEVDILGFPVDQGGGYRKAGLMVRGGPAADAPRVMVQNIPHAPLAAGDRTMLQFDYRDANGVTNTVASNILDLPLPLRLAIDRRGDVLSVYYSTDGGDNWVHPLGGSGGSIEIAMPDPLMVGMAVASYDANLELTAEFDDFSLCRPNDAPAVPMAPPRACDGSAGIDLVLALDLSGSMTAAYPGSGSRLAAAQQAMTQLTADIGQGIPGSRVALVTYAGGFTVADNLANGVTVESGLTTDLSAIDTLVNGFDAASIDPDASTPTALAVAKITDLLAMEHDGVRRPVVVFLTDGVPNVDRAGQGPFGYGIDEIQDLTLRDDQGNFLPWPLVGWTGSFNRRFTTYAGEPSAGAMYELETLAAAQSQARIYGVALQGDGAGLGSFDEGLLEYGAHLSDAVAYSAADTTSLLAALDELADELACTAGVDQDPPVIEILTPGSTVTNDSTPQIVISYSDASAINPFVVEISVDGDLIGPDCAITADQVICEAPELAVGTHLIEVGLRDLLDNVAEASLQFTLSFDDTTPPTLAITSPAAGEEKFASQMLQVELAYSDASGVDLDSLQVTLNDTDIASSACTVGAATASCPVTAQLRPGAYELSATVADPAGNSTTVGHGFRLVERAPIVTLDEGIDGTVTVDNQLTVSGTVDAPVASVEVNGVAASLSGQSFSADLELVEGTNRIVATAVGIDGLTGAAALTVRLDTQAPRLVFESPRQNDVIAGATITVAGTVSDIIPGATVNADDVTVTINGMPAAVDNRTFIVPDLPLAQGANTIVGEVVDRAGNLSTTTLEVVRRDDPIGLRLEIVSGNNQFGSILTDLADPLVVRLSGPSGQPLADRPVEFQVSRGDGVFGDPANRLRSVQVLTAADGTASIDFRLGSRTGEGFHRVLASSPGAAMPVELCATAQGTAATTIDITMDPPPRGIAGQLLSDRLSVIVRDAGGNPVAGQEVIFRVERGGGTLASDMGPMPIVLVDTNADGIAEAEWTLGNTPGTDNQRVVADFVGNTDLPLAFVVSAIELGPPAETAIRGVVQDSVGGPIVGARATVRGTALEAFTGTDGVFEITNVPPGGHHVVVHGSTANDPASDRFFPDIEFAVEAISGHTNDLGQEVVLPFLDMSGAKLVGGDEDVILEMAGVEGFAIKIFAGSVILHDGSRGEIMMSSSQVKVDKVPMPPPQGSTPFVVGTLQPGGIHFDPPAQVIYPNIAELDPGDVADVFAFHHDIGQFVNIGPGTVSEDATVVASDPGFGIVQSGWHCLIRQPGPRSNCRNECEAEISWSPIDGASAEMGTSEDLPVKLYAATGAGSTKAKVRAFFTPGGGALEGSWSATSPVVIEDPAGNVTTVSGSGPGMGSARSPLYRFMDTATCRADIPVEVEDLTLEVEEVSIFDDYTLEKDMIGQDAETIFDPVWESGGEAPKPAAVRHEMPIKFAAKFKVDSDIETPPTGVKVRATGPDDIKIDATEVTFDAQTKLFVLNETPTMENLPTGTKYYPSMTLDWEFSLDGTNFASAGSSTHELFVTLGAETKKTFLTVMTLAVAGGGATDKQGAFDNTWAEFSTGSGPADVTNWENEPLAYYPAGSTFASGSSGPSCSGNPKGVLKSGLSECGGMQKLMRDALEINDIEVRRINVWSKRPTDGKIGGQFLVKNWQIDSGCSQSAPPFCEFFMDVTITQPPLLPNFGMVPAPPTPPGFGDAVNGTGIPGQNSMTPSQKAFGVHFILEVTGMGPEPFYDPSYGVTYNGPSGFATKAVDGYIYPSGLENTEENGQTLQNFILIPGNGISLITFKAVRER